MTSTPARSHPPRIAIAHDWLCGFRGGEAVLDRIARIVADIAEPAGLYVMVDDGRPLTPAIDALPRTTSPLQRFPGGAGRLRRWLLPLYPAAVDSLSRTLACDHTKRQIDLLISTSSAAIKGLKPPPGVPHLCYCHAPARYIWSQQADYEVGKGGRLRSAGLRLFGARLRAWDRDTAANVTVFLANSRHTAEQVKACYGREAEVLHPPVRMEFFTPDPSVKRGDEWLFVSALEPYKRGDLAIKAANVAKHPLIVAGSGSQEAYLRSIAGPTVRFEGRVGHERLRELYRSSRLLIFPQLEDFGIVAAEAQACGLPVVAFAGGGALDSVVDGVTGVHFAKPEVEDVLAAIKRLPTEPAAVAQMARACRENAMRFSEERFDAAMRGRVEAMLTAM